jgi:hypothetical protein
MLDSWKQLGIGFHGLLTNGCGSPATATVNRLSGSADDSTTVD